LVGGVVDDQVDDHPDPPLLGAVRELDEVPECPVSRIHAVVVGHIVAVVATGRRLERHQPDGGDAETVQVVEPAHEPGEVAYPIAVGVHEGPDRQAIDDGVLVPEIVDRGRRAALVRLRGAAAPHSFHMVLQPHCGHGPGGASARSASCAVVATFVSAGLDSPEDRVSGPGSDRISALHFGHCIA